MQNSFYSHGKLLITGEYLVLHGARALAVPVKLGQTLIIEPTNSGLITWETFELENKIFAAQLKLNNLAHISSNDKKKAMYIRQLLMAAQNLNPGFLSEYKGIAIKAEIHFRLDWGLGSSSTLINNIAQWAGIDPFLLNSSVSQGSGYDIACASAKSSIIYQLVYNKPVINQVDFNPLFIENLVLVHLNKKEATEKNIVKHLIKKSNYNYFIDKINMLTNTITKCSSLNTFIELLNEHEQLIAKVLLKKPVKMKYFDDFTGAVKSLGAWGGDFAMAASHQSFIEQRNYFSNKGFATVIPFKDFLI